MLVYIGIAAGVVWTWEGASVDRRRELFLIVYVVTFGVGAYLQYRYAQLSQRTEGKVRKKE